MNFRLLAAAATAALLLLPAPSRAQTFSDTQKGEIEKIIKDYLLAHPEVLEEVSAELQCSEDEVRALIRDGELRTVACGIRPGLVPRHEFDDYLRRHRRGGSPRSSPAP